jgi:hypothetical protein
VAGRRWKLPSGAADLEARARILARLGVGEGAVADAPPRGHRENILTEVFPAERRWLTQVALDHGLAKTPSAARAIRLLMRAAIVNREWLGLPPLEEPYPEWFVEDPVSTATRLSALLDSLPIDKLAQLLSEVQSAIDRRKKV